MVFFRDLPSWASVHFCSLLEKYVVVVAAAAVRKLSSLAYHLESEQCALSLTTIGGYLSPHAASFANLPTLPSTADCLELVEMAVLRAS